MPIHYRSTPAPSTTVGRLAIRSRVQYFRRESAANPLVTFIDRLCPELIRVAAPWRTLDATARGLAEMLARQRLLAEAAVDEAVRAVLAREAVQSTALLDVGAAVPHARLNGLAHASVGLAITREGLYEAVPTVRVSIVALVLSPHEAMDEHLQMLASIATALRSAELRAALLSAPDPQRAHRSLLRHIHVPA